MDKELRNPPSKPVKWGFVRRVGEGIFEDTTATAQTAWKAVASVGWAFQECSNFVQLEEE